MNKSCSIFALPLVEVLQPITQHIKQQEDAAAKLGEEAQRDRAPMASSSVRSCQMCAAEFETQLEFRQHFKSAQHQDNMKRKLVESMESVDISAVADNEGTGDSNVTVSRQDGMVQIKINDQQIQFDVHKMILLSGNGRRERGESSDIDLLKRLILLNSMPSKWAVILFSGGDFACCLFENIPSTVSSGTAKAPVTTSSKILLHKTLHRYTVRRKQGGSQSGKDNQGGNKPKSAGAMMRRRNEHLLQQDINDLLISPLWNDALTECDRVWIYAPGAVNRSVIDRALDEITDMQSETVVNVGLNVGKPTFEECQRVYDLLTTVSLHRPTS